MKTLKKYTCLILTVVLTVGCEDHESDIVPIPPGPQNSAEVGSYFEATVELQGTSIAPVDFVPDQIINVRYSGSGDSNLMGLVNFTSNHEEKLLNQHVVADINYGQFTLRSKVTSDAISGSYEGLGSTWTLVITGGKGKFTSARGTLSLVISKGDSFNGPLAMISGSIITDES